MPIHNVKFYLGSQKIYQHSNDLTKMAIQHTVNAERENVLSAIVTL